MDKLHKIIFTLEQKLHRTLFPLNKSSLGIQVLYGSVSPGREFALFNVFFNILFKLAATKLSELALISQLFLKI